MTQEKTCTNECLRLKLFPTVFDLFLKYLGQINSKALSHKIRKSKQISKLMQSLADSLMGFSGVAPARLKMNESLRTWRTAEFTPPSCYNST